MTGRVLLTVLAIVSLALLLPRRLEVVLQPSVHAASTFIVTNVNDSGIGSLRQAILDANANTGADTIAFNIPGAGVQTISPASALPPITDPVTVDGYTQPGASFNTLPDGENAVLLVELNGSTIPGSASGLRISSSNCTVRGLIINRFSGDGISFTSASGTTTNNLVEGNFIGTDPSGSISRGNNNGVSITFSNNNLIGGTTPAARNVISGNGGRGISVTTGASGTTIQGNFIGTTAAGSAALGNNSGGILSGGNGPDTIGGTADGARNVISGNLNNAGIFVQSGTAIGPTIQGNLIGTDVTGTVALGNAFGIWLNFGPSLGNGMIGGLVPSARNVISGNRSDGVFISGSSRNNQLVGNFIGTDITGTRPLGNAGHGVQIDAFATSNKIGGAVPGQGNTIAFNGRNGIFVLGSLNATGNAFRRNSIFSNGLLGIDLGGDGVTANDPGDNDPGPNNLQNFPVITSVTEDAGQTTITGTLNSTPNTAFSVNFYSTSACDPSGNGEGTTPFGPGSISTTTDANGDATFGVMLPSTLAAGEVITATATDPAGNTSEFSACNPGRAAGSIQFSAPSIKVIEDVGFVTLSVVRTGGTSGGLTVDYATANITAIAGEDYVASSGTITFNDGETSKSFDIPITDDATTEPDETFAVRLSNGTKLDTVGSPNQEIITLQDHNTPPVLSINSVSVNESDTGTTNAVFSVTLSPLTGRTVTVDYFTQALNATSGVDFQPMSGSLNFGPRVTTQTITVPIIGDTLDEFDETFNVILTNPTNAAIGSGPGVGTIIDNDPPPSASISDVSIAEGNFPGLTFAQFALSLSASSGKSVCVQASTSDGTATAGSDYLPYGTGITNPPAFVFFDGGATTATLTVNIIGDANAEPDENFFVNLIPCNGNVTISRARAMGTILNDDPPVTVQFSALTYTVNETSPGVTVTVQRTGDLSASATVGYATSDTSGANNCNVISGVASSRCDYLATLGTLHFAANETSKTISIPIVDDSYAEGSESFTITLSNPSGATLGSPAAATVTITDNDAVNGTNQIDISGYFVRLHYIDFLNREPDAPGFSFWTGEIENCTPKPQCTETKRINVSTAFYLSIEFQGTGYLVDRIYKASYGDAIGTSTFNGGHQLSVPVVRFKEFLSDTQEIGLGVIVGQGSWQQQLENNKQAFCAEFVQRSRFTTAFPSSMTAAEFVDKLNANAGNPLSPSERDQLVTDLSTNAKTRAQVLRAVAEDPDLNNVEFNRAFVLMQYFGYLRRNPNDAPDTDYTGYDFWLTKLNNFTQPGDDALVRVQKADMVKAFIVSAEYRNRFGP